MKDRGSSTCARAPGECRALPRRSQIPGTSASRRPRMLDARGNSLTPARSMRPWPRPCRLCRMPGRRTDRGQRERKNLMTRKNILSPGQARGRPLGPLRRGWWCCGACLKCQNTDSFEIRRSCDVSWVRISQLRASGHLWHSNPHRS